MCAPSPPPAPDYAGAAVAQGAANKEAAIASSQLNNPNVVNPYGTQTWTEGANPGDRGTVTQTYSPEQQALYDQSLKNKGLMGDLANQGITSLQGIVGTPVDTRGLTDAAKLDFSGAPQSTGYDFSGAPQSTGYDFSGAPALRSTDFTSGAPALRSTDFTSGAQNFSGTDFTAGAAAMPGSAEATRNQVISAMMGRANEDYAKQSDNSNSNLIAAGIRPGTKAYADQQQMIERSRNDARQQAEIAGGNAAQQQFGMDLARRQQGVGEASQQFQATSQQRAQQVAEQQAQFVASATARGMSVQEAQAQFQASHAARQQAVAEETATANMQNQLRDRYVAEETATANMQNQLRGQYVSENTAQTNQQNQLRQEQIKEYLTARQTPLNEINALLSGSQVSNPFAVPNPSSPSNVTPAPVYGAANAAGQYGTDVYNQQAASAANTRNGLFSLGAAAIASDRRLKSNIVRIGDHPLGIGIYRYNIFGKPDIGVMADEVLSVRPEAVLTHPDGYMMVNYGML